ncbi:MAG: hypothetical protein R3F59_11255 [Myxococcota bacterium]
MALTMAGDPVRAAEIRSSLRYGEGVLATTSTGAFMELQWIPGGDRRRLDPRRHPGLRRGRHPRQGQ